MSLGQLVCKFSRRLNSATGGEGGIRTPGRGFSPYNGLANRRIQPLCHLSAACFQQLTTVPISPTKERDAERNASMLGALAQNRSVLCRANRVSVGILDARHANCIPP